MSDSLREVILTCVCGGKLEPEPFIGCCVAACDYCTRKRNESVKVRCTVCGAVIAGVLAKVLDPSTEFMVAKK